ncbi:MAG: hypothetical protein FJ271_25220 [Planctomycetes bacterium]|nr:hypothetical protein [Planctomycetota bacterium]
MTQRPPRRSVSLAVERLEDRYTPQGGGTVTGSLAGHVYTVTGDVHYNDVTLAGTGTPGAFTLTGNNATTVTGLANPTGVTKVVFDMQGGHDNVTVNGARLKRLVFLGGEGNNIFQATNLVLSENLRIINGAGLDNTNVRNFRINGNVTINNGDGGSYTYLYALSAGFGFCRVGGNVVVAHSATASVCRDFETGAAAR